jgi:hypothetical protein
MTAFSLAGHGRLVVDLMRNDGAYTNNEKGLVQPRRCRLSVMWSCQEVAIEHTYLR